MHLYKSINIIDSGKAILLKTADGKSLRFHSTWLRDNAQDLDTRDIKNGQRLITLSDIPVNISIELASLKENGKKISLTFIPEKKTITFSSKWLETYAYDYSRDYKKGWTDPNLKIWNKDILKNIPIENFNNVSKNNSSLLKWLKLLNIYGFAKLTGCKKESGSILRVAELFGYVRETNYGKFFDVKSNIDAINLAYTNRGLSPHTDNPYRDPVPSIQILFCLENSTQGGRSIVVDGFFAAMELKKKNPKYFELLTKYNVNFEFKGDKNAYLQSSHPLIEISTSGEIKSIRFNNRSAAPITDVPYDDMDNYYKAYREFSNIINDPELALEFRLNPGECFILDNTRVLHARTSFEGGGTRWLQGCYVDKDGLLSKISTMSAL